MASADVTAHTIPEVNGFPNSSINSLPLLVYRRAFPAEIIGSGSELASHIEEIFTKNGYPPQWRYGMYPFSHYHSTSHEVLGVYQGSARLRFGGDDVSHGAVEEEVTAGDAIVVPGECWRRAQERGTARRVRHGGRVPRGGSLGHVPGQAGGARRSLGIHSTAGGAREGPGLWRCRAPRDLLEKGLRRDGVIWALETGSRVSGLSGLGTRSLGRPSPADACGGSGEERPRSPVEIDDPDPPDWIPHREPATPESFVRQWGAHSDWICGASVGINQIGRTIHDTMDQSDWIWTVDGGRETLGMDHVMLSLPASVNTKRNQGTSEGGEGGGR